MLSSQDVIKEVNIYLAVHTRLNAVTLAEHAKGRF